MLEETQNKSKRHNFLSHGVLNCHPGAACGLSHDFLGPAG